MVPNRTSIQVILRSRDRKVVKLLKLRRGSMVGSVLVKSGLIVIISMVSQRGKTKETEGSFDVMEVGRIDVHRDKYIGSHVRVLRSG